MTWKALVGLLGLSFICLMSCVVSWFVLLFNICSNPRAVDAATHHTIPYNCHGMTVFITPLQQHLLDWLGPVGLFFILVNFMLLAVVLHLHKTRAT